MNKKKKPILKILVLLISVFIFTGCTSNFCNSKDKANIKEYILTQVDQESGKTNQEIWQEQARESGLTDEDEIADYVNSKLNKAYKNYDKSCIVIDDYETEEGIKLSKKSWKDAWKEGLMEGLLVYPISALMIFFINIMGKTGFAKFMAIVLITFVTKLFTLLITWKSTKQTQRMQAIQPELMDIQQKYQNAQSPQEKQRYALKMQEVYTKNHINPLSMLITPFVTMPIFIAIWGAVKGITPLQEGSFLGLSLGNKLSSQVFDFNIFAIIVFVVMIVAQILSMKLPTWLSNHKLKKAHKPIPKNNMNGTLIFMLVIIIWTGLFLPAAMALYWTVSAVFSAVQALFMHYYSEKKKGEKKYEKVYK